MGSETSQAASSTRANFFSLPREIRDDIYDRVLAIPNPLYIFQETPDSPVHCFTPRRPRKWLALLYTTRQLHSEASHAFYRAHQFEIVDSHETRISEYLQSFINCIGPTNAASLAHLCIEFPRLEPGNGKPDKIRINNDSLRNLQLLQRMCTRLATLELTIHSKNAGLIIDRADDLVQEALLVIKKQLGLISSLRKVVVRVMYGKGTLSAAALESMQRLGWEVKKT
jgi:hypothetical protein